MVVSLAALTVVLPGGWTWADKSGDLDPKFGRGGVVTTDLGIAARPDRYDFDVIKDVIVQKDSKILAVGTFFYDSVLPSADSDFALARYNSDGSLDEDFAAGGKHVHDIGYQEKFYSAALQADDKIVAGGAGIPHTSDHNAVLDALVQRYLPNGLPDLEFGIAGQVTIPFYPEVMGANTHVSDVAIQPDGKILAAGEVGHSRPSFLLRLAKDGRRDNSFGVEGIVRVPFGRISALSIEPQSQKMVVAGNAGSWNEHDFALARYNKDGTIDTSFGNGGWQRTDLGTQSDEVNAMALQKDGKILLAGASDRRLALARYNPDGTLDGTYAQNGIAIKPIETANDKDYAATALAIQPDNRVVVAAGAGGFHGTGPQTNGGNSDFVLVRLEPDGASDASFGTNGIQVTDIAEGDSVNAIAIQPDRSIVAAGSNGFDFALARYVDPLADLSLQKSISADVVNEGETATFTIRVNNAGPTAAQEVALNDPIPAGFVPSSVRASQGSCTSSDGAVNCSLGEVGPSGHAEVTLEGTAATAGTISNTATVSASSPDPDTSNNVDSAVLRVVRPDAPPGPVLPSLQPELSGISPECGPTSGGTEVNLYGKNLQKTSGVRFGDLDLPTGQITIISDTHVKAISPVHPPGAVPLSVESPEGLVPSALRFTFPCKEAPQALEEDGLRAGLSVAASQKALGMPPGGGGVFSSPAKAAVFASAPVAEPGLVSNPGPVSQPASPEATSFRAPVPGSAGDSTAPVLGVSHQPPANAPAPAQRHAMTAVSAPAAAMLCTGALAALAMAAIAFGSAVRSADKPRAAVCFDSL